MRPRLCRTPTLPTLKPGGSVIADNLGSHKAKAVRNAISNAGARLWVLPPYSPDLNPIERAFAKIKHWMRMAQKRDAGDAWRHVGHIVGTFTQTERQNDGSNAGYKSIKRDAL